MSRWTLDGLECAVERFRLGPVDLDLAPGTAVAVVGRSGAGKTTLLRTVAGFVPATAGRLARDGTELTDEAPEVRRVGYVPQGLGLFPHLSVEENVRYPLELRRRSDAVRSARALLGRFGIAPLADRLPHRLSSGEAQKVALARALAAEPELLLWDEPAHALDVDARDELSGVFDDMARHEGVPLLLVTHDPTLAFGLAERFLLLHGGSVEFAGDASALLARPPDLFTARFCGFDNVLGRPALEGAGTPFAAWLLARSGPEGVAFPSVGVATDGPSRVTGEVVAARPRPDGVALEVDVGSLRLRARSASFGPALRAGSTIALSLAEEQLRPLGPGPRAGRTG